MKPLSREEKIAQRTDEILGRISERKPKFVRSYSATPEQEAGWKAWRAKLPWTDAELAQVYYNFADRFASTGWTGKAAQLRSMGDRVASGHLAKGDMDCLMYELVKTCGICGKTAYCRMGATGRCYEHRSVLTEGMQQYRAMWNRLQAAQSDDMNKADRLMRIKDKAKNYDHTKRRKA